MKRRHQSKRSTGRRRRGGDIGAWFRDVGAKIKNEFTNPNSKLGQVGAKIKNEFTNPNSNLAREFTNKDSLLRSKILPNAARYLGWVPGVGKVLKVANLVNKGAAMAGYGRRRRGAKKTTRKARR